MTDPRSDAQLVRDHLSGDRSALAAMFDRFGPSLFDTAAAMTGDRHDAADLLQDVFVMAAERLGQLRDHDRLKAWLFAVLRNEVYRRTKKRSRVRPTDFNSPDVPEMAAPIDHQADAEMVAYSELAELVRAAAGGLDERDQLMLELSVRQGLQGADLAAAMGVTPEQSYTLVHRMRERVERSLGALVVARAGRRDCPELATLLAGWDGQFTILVRKRVARHVEACETCTRTRTKAAPIALFGAAPVLAMPAGLRDRVLTAAADVTPAAPSSAPTTGRHGYRFDAPDGFPGLVRTGIRVSAWLAAAAAVLFVAFGGAILVQSTRGSDSASLASTTSAAAIETAAPTTAPAVEPTAAPDTSSTGPATSGPTTSAPRQTTTTTTPPTTTIVPTTPAPVTTVGGVVVVPTTPPVVTSPTTQAPTTTAVVTTTQPPRTTTTTVAPVEGRIALSANVVDLGATSPSATVTVTNTGETPVTWGISGSSGVFSLSASPGTLAPGAQSTIVVSIDRSVLKEGDYTATVDITGRGGAPLTMLASLDEAPVIGGLKLAPNPPTATFEALLSTFITDASGVSASVSWTGSSTGSATLSGGRGGYSARITFASQGTHVLTVTATDSRGNSSSSSITVNVSPYIG